MLEFWSRVVQHSVFVLFFFFNDTATTEIYTLSLHDALPIFTAEDAMVIIGTVIDDEMEDRLRVTMIATGLGGRSEEHTSELQSLTNLVCRLLLEKKK